MRVDVEERQTEQAGPDAPIDKPVAPAHDRWPFGAPAAAPHQARFCRTADTLELAAVRAARTVLITPVAVTTARPEGSRRPAAASIRSFLLLRRNNIV
jgi:hypothetical protein